MYFWSKDFCLTNSLDVWDVSVIEDVLDTEHASHCVYEHIYYNVLMDTNILSYAPKGRTYDASRRSL